MFSPPLPGHPDLLRVMKASPLFCALRPGPLELVARRGAVRGYEAGETVFQAGEPADRFFLVVSGRVKVFKLSARGGEQILHSYGPGPLSARRPCGRAGASRPIPRP